MNPFTALATLALSLGLLVAVGAPTHAGRDRCLRGERLIRCEVRR